MAGEFVTDNAYDAALDYVADNGDELFLCSQAPTTYTEASVTYALNAAHAVTVGDGGGDYTIDAGATDGRELNLAEQAITPDTTGSCTHVAITDGVSELLKVNAMAATYSIESGTVFTMAAGILWTVRDTT